MRRALSCLVFGLTLLGLAVVEMRSYAPSRFVLVYGTLSAGLVSTLLGSLWVLFRWRYGAMYEKESWRPGSSSADVSGVGSSGGDFSHSYGAGGHDGHGGL